jgi:hypothetical protein
MNVFCFLFFCFFIHIPNDNFKLDGPKGSAANAGKYNDKQFASSVPTAGGVYHWASIAAGPKWGRMVGFFTGWINFYGWMFDLASLLQIAANISVNMYSIYHQDTYEYAAWHVYVAYILVLVFSTAIVVFANRIIPHTQNLGMFFVIVGGIITIIVISAMPATHATNHFVWASFDENNGTGWPGGVAFLLGVLNGAFTIGTPDAITHLAEELPHPKRDLPKAIGLQIGLGFLCKSWKQKKSRLPNESHCHGKSANMLLSFFSFPLPKTPLPLPLRWAMPSPTSTPS